MEHSRKNFEILKKKTGQNSCVETARKKKEYKNGSIFNDCNLRCIQCSGALVRSKVSVSLNIFFNPKNIYDDESQRSTAWNAGARHAALGFALVAIAAIVGTLRFMGFQQFAKANANLADLAAFVGLPMIGMEYMMMTTNFMGNPWPFLEYLQQDMLICIVGLLIFWRFSEGVFSSNSTTNLVTVLNLAMFVLPIVNHGMATNDQETLIAVGLFAFAGVFIGSDRKRTILGMRRENWFHYFIGLSSTMLAVRLAGENFQSLIKEMTKQFHPEL